MARHVHLVGSVGLDTVGDNDGMPRAFTAMLEATAQKERPCTAIVVSEAGVAIRFLFVNLFRFISRD